MKNPELAKRLGISVKEISALFRSMGKRIEFVVKDRE